jgi:testis-specific serine kinase
MSSKKDKSSKPKGQKSKKPDQRVSLEPEPVLLEDTPPAEKTADENQPIEEVGQTPRTIFEQHGLHVYRQIGCGTYAKVKLAYSDALRTMVAVKIISKYNAPSEFLESFMPRELEIVRSIRHENIIRFYQSIETNHRLGLR